MASCIVKLSAVSNSPIFEKQQVIEHTEHQGAWLMNGKNNRHIRCLRDFHKILDDRVSGGGV